MLIRSLTLATLMAFTGPLLAADDNPLKQELGKTRPWWSWSLMLETRHWQR